VLENILKNIKASIIPTFLTFSLACNAAGLGPYIKSQDQNQERGIKAYLTNRETQSNKYNCIDDKTKREKKQEEKEKEHTKEKIICTRSDKLGDFDYQINHAELNFGFHYLGRVKRNKVSSLADVESNNNQVNLGKEVKQKGKKYNFDTALRFDLTNVGSGPFRIRTIGGVGVTWNTSFFTTELLGQIQYINENGEIQEEDVKVDIFEFENTDVIYYIPIGFEMKVGTIRFRPDLNANFTRKGFKGLSTTMWLTYGN
jgi:hypothetical protein